MKKLILLIAVLALAGCKPMDRKNPTDPLGTNYGGLTYLGEIGSFTTLSDFTLAVDPSDSKDYIFAIDSSKEEVHKYSVNGTAMGIIPNPATPVFFNPTGVAEVLGYCYIMDTVSIDAFRINNLNDAWTDTAVNGDKILSYGNRLYAAVSDPPGIFPYLPDGPGQTLTAVTPWVITKGNTSCTNCVSYISGMEANSNTNEIMLVDSGNKRISSFSTAGVWSKNIDVGSDIIGAAYWPASNTLYVPTANGIKRYNYTTLALIDTIADYGEGNGKIMRPGPIELYQSPAPENKYYIFVGAGTFIKVFEINGL